MANGIEDKLVDEWTKEGHDKLFESVVRARESEAGKQAVESKQKKQRQKDLDELIYSVESYRKYVDKAPERIKELVDEGYSYEDAETYVNRAIPLRLKSLRDKGYLYDVDRGPDIPRDIVLEDIQRYRPSASAFVDSKTNRIIMPRRPLDPKGQMEWEGTYQHELGHQSRNVRGELLSTEEPLWHQRPEEQQAIKDQLSALKENYKRAGIPYDPISAYRLLAGSSELEAMENPSKAPFREKYLPTGSEYKRNVLGKEFDNPGDYLNAILDIQNRAQKTGLGIKYNDFSDFLASSKGQHLSTLWDLANE